MGWRWRQRGCSEKENRWTFSWQYPFLRKSQSLLFQSLGKSLNIYKKKCYILQYDVEGLNFNLASNSAKKKKDLLDDLFGKEIQEWSEYKDQKSIKKETFIRQKGKQNDNNSSKTVIAWQTFSQPGQRMSRINENDYKTFDFGEFCTKWYWLWHVAAFSFKSQYSWF